MSKPLDSHEPIRTCIGCRQRRPQGAMSRYALDSHGAISVGRVAPGRGAWICGQGCFHLAMRKRAFDRAWRTSVQPGSLETFAAELNDLPGGI